MESVEEVLLTESYHVMDRCLSRCIIVQINIRKDILRVIERMRILNLRASPFRGISISANQMRATTMTYHYV